MFNRSAQSMLSNVLPGFVAIAALGFTASVPQTASAASLTPVDLELSLLVDVSPSINGREYALQMEGYRDAFVNLSSRFGAGDFGSVAINFIQWAGPNSQQESIPWTLVNDQASALQFADAIDAVVRPPFFFSTAPGSAIQFALPLFSSNDYDGQRWVIDVSGDDPANSGATTRVARDNALAAGVSAINGLPILPVTFRSNLDVWYANNVQGGVGSFTLPAQGFEDFGRAVEQKLLLELTPPGTDGTVKPPAAVPEPTTILGIALAGSGLTYLKRRLRTV